MKADPTPGAHSGLAAEFKPYIPADRTIPEFGFAPVAVGAILGIIFGASSLYLMLKVGMTVSASIPIAVLSITLFRAFRPLMGRNATILENNMVQTTGSGGESIAFGVGCTMPALLILGYDLEATRVMLVAVLGGLLGVLMMIPLRRAFIVKQHGILPFPEGTACADVLIVGEKGGGSAKTVFVGFGVAFIYNFVMSGFRLWDEVQQRLIGFFRGASVSCELNPALLGVGYIIGTRVSCIMVGGGVLASWVLVPVIVLFGSGLNEPLFPADKLIRDMSITDIWKTYVLYIGAGAVAAGGIISMCQSLPMILATIHAGVRDIASSERSTGAFVKGASARRTERDVSLRIVLVGTLGLILAIWAAPMLHMNLLGAILIVLFGFLFVTVASRLCGMIGSSSNPISGMTVATLLMTCLIFLTLGLTTESDKVTALSIAGIVCVAASNGGATSQDLKTGFLVGSTPRSQQIGRLVGALTSALVIGSMLLVLNDGKTIYTKKNLPTQKVEVLAGTPKQTIRGVEASQDANEYYAVHFSLGDKEGIPAGKYLVDDAGTIRYFVDPGINGQLEYRDDGTKVDKFTAPKAALMSFIIDGILTQKLPWSLVLLGVAIAIVLELSSIPALPFAVGVYLPLSTSVPIFLGGMLRWIADKLARRSAGEGEMSPGVLLSSGFIAGGTIAGIITTVIGLWWQIGVDAKSLPHWMHAGWVGLAPFAGLVLLLLFVGAGKWMRSEE